MVLIYLLGLVIIVLISLYYYLTWNYDYWQKQGIPYDKNITPGLGNIASIIFLRENLSSLCEKYYKAHKKYSVFGFYQLRTPTLLIRDPELVKSILTTNFANFANNQYQSSTAKRFKIYTMNPFLSKIDTWKENCAPLSNAFSSKKLKFMLPFIHDVGTNLELYLKRKVDFHHGKIELELKEFCNLFTGEIAATGIGFQSHKFHDETESTKDRWAFKRFIEKFFSEPFFSGGFQQMIVFFFPELTNIFSMTNMPEYANNFFHDILKNILTYRKRENIRGNDFLQIMVDYYNANGLTIDDNVSFTSHMLTFSTETYESSAITLSFLLFQLAAHPEVQEKVREEVRDILEQCNGKLEYDDFKKMTYLEQVLNESMRLNHAIGNLLKVCTKETQLVGSDGLSCRIKPGSVAIISAYGLQMDPDYWPDPEKFDPDRFSDEQKAGRHKFTFLPFGEGPRICVAMRMAIIVIKLMVTIVLKNYQIQVSSKSPFPPVKSEVSFMSAYQEGLWVIFKPLEHNL